jgi:hypothetical protein
MNGRDPVVIDTNVTIVANRKHRESISCANACAQALVRTTNRGILLLDDGERILQQYRTYLSHSGQPGVGDLFFKWLMDHRWYPELVNHVPVTPEDVREFVEFPETAALETFDRSDRIFVAVSLSHGGNAPILNATDRDWWDHKDALDEAGIEVLFLCPERFDRP